MAELLQIQLYTQLFFQVACCGSEGPNDFLDMRQPLPIECRDTVTGHAFANGCVDELTWYLEDKSIWAAAMAMTLAMLHVIIKRKKLLKLYVGTNCDVFFFRS